VAKTVISKRDLDALIRMHLVNLPEDCASIVPMPVVWRARTRAGCNWVVPGWTGDSDTVQRCLDRLRLQLRQLRSAYDIPDEH
jgi:hypothetical protein